MPGIGIGIGMLGRVVDVPDEVPLFGVDGDVVWACATVAKTREADRIKPGSPFFMSIHLSKTEISVRRRSLQRHR
jgi:hypothetical protein